MAQQRTRIQGGRHPSAASILVVDENEIHQTMVVIEFGRLGFRVKTASRGSEALRQASHQSFDAFVVDSKLRDVSAFDVLSALAQRFPDTPRILLIPPGSDDLLIRGMESGATSYVAKTPRFGEILPAVVDGLVKNMVDRRRMVAQEQALVEGDLARRRELDIREAIFEVSEAASTAGDLQHLFRAVHRIVGKLMPAGNFYIALVDPDTASVSFPYFVDEHEAAPAPQPFGRGLTEYVHRTGQPLLADPDVFQDLMSKGEVDAVGAPSVDWLGVPLVADGQALGVLAVQTYADRVRLGPTEKDILAYVSTQVAMAIARVRKDGALRESQHTLSALLANVPGMVYRARYLPPDVSYEFVSEGATMTGSKPADFLEATMDPSRLVDPEDAVRNRAEIDAAVQEDRPYQLIYRIRTAAGGARWVWEQGRPTSSPRGTILEGFVIDITERKEIEEELRVAKERFDLVGRATNDVIWDWDLATGRIWWSSALAVRFGYAPEEIGADYEWWLARIHPDDRALVETSFQAALVRGETHYEADYRFRRKDGSFADVSDRAFVIQGRDGAPLRVIGSMLDLTERKKNARQAAETERLAALNQMAFYLAHEINTPLTSISLLTSSLERTSTEPAVRDKLAKIHAHRRRAAAIASTLPTLPMRSKIEAVTVDLRGVIGEAIAAVAAFQKPGVDVRTRLGDRPVWLRVDPASLKTVVANLVKNALQATERGSVTVSLEEGPDAIHISVDDTGAGMSDVSLGRLFEPFFSTKAPEEAAGLGLAWSKSLVEAHGGQILVSSVPGEGATFTVLLPRTLSAGT